MLRRLVVLAVLLIPSAALAVPGPDSVAVVANADVPESVALAQLYARVRGVPDAQVCLLSVPTDATIDFSVFRDDVFGPLKACLASVIDRIEAIVLVRGVPLRVRIPDGGAARLASMAAALGVWDTTLADGTPLLGQPPGNPATCAGNTPCYQARYGNPYTDRLFEPGWTRTVRGIVWRPMLVTMLHGRTYADAQKLIASATTAEALGQVPGTWMFMEGRDPARSFLDGTFDAVITELGATPVTDIERVAFNTALTGRTLGAFVVGTASLGETIEGNTFSPGALVDNLTSFGAVPQNFEPMGESQVSVARWVAKGVAGAHGTTAEPLANTFPDRRFLVDYAGGMTLAEAYLRRMPFVYWQNLVLGDPMAAPYAVRPQVNLRGLEPDENVVGAQKVQIDAFDPQGRGFDSIRLFINGVEVEATRGTPIDACVVLSEGPVHVLAVAQAFGLGDAIDGFSPKGWVSFRMTATAGATDCSAPPDAGVLTDAGESVDARDTEMPDAGTSIREPEMEGCACTSGATTQKESAFWILGFVAVLIGRRRR